MAIIFNLDVMLAKRKMKLQDLAKSIGITPQNLSILKTGKSKSIRLELLSKLCTALDCQPKDLLEYKNRSG